MPQNQKQSAMVELQHINQLGKRCVHLSPVRPVEAMETDEKL